MEIIKNLEKLSISVLSDALDQLGVDGGCHLIPRTKNTNVVGRAFTVKFKRIESGNFAKAADYIENVKKGEVIFIDNNGNTDCSVWGKILTETAIIKKVAGTVIYGACRDISEIKNFKYPVFSKDAFMKTGKNRVILDYVQKPVSIANVVINPGDYIKGDESGIIVIPAELAEQVIERAKKITANEDKITKAVRRGMDLDKAREKYNYNFLPFNKKDGNN